MIRLPYAGQLTADAHLRPAVFCDQYAPLSRKSAICMVLIPS